jgi:dienelactone hydrolase
MSRSLIVLLALVLSSTLALTTFGADDPIAKELLEDRRLTVSHDVDHPVTFDPTQYKDKAAWEARAAQLRQQALVAEGLWPMPEKTPLNPVIHGKIDRHAYTIENVFFASVPGHYVSGNLYRPKGREGKLPAVLCPHGHWKNGRLYERTDAEAKKQMDEGAETMMEGAKYPIQARCAMLARMGCIVFVYDMIGYADSKTIEHRTGFTDAEALLRLQSFMGLQTWNSIRALDFVTSLPDVDTSRIGVTGASGGGTQTILLSVMDDRVSAAFPAVMVSEAMQGGCICENAPLLRVGTNNVELMATFAPKPLAMSAANDWTIALETDGLPKLQQIYSLFGAKDKVAGKHFSFEHNYNQWSREMMYNWFNKYLKLGVPAPVKEAPWKPATPAELSVYDDEHPLPKDARDAKAVRKYLTESSDRQLEELFKKDPEEYRRVVRTALGVMVNDQLPSAGDVVVAHSSGPHMVSDTLVKVIETGALSRRNGSEAVPFSLWIPKRWDGTVTVWAHPQGIAYVRDDESGSAKKRQLLESRSAVICADIFGTGEFAPAAKFAPAMSVTGYAKQKYAGFLHGYNRGVLANQVHDLLTEIAFVKNWAGATRVQLIASDKVGVPALLADALSGDALTDVVVDVENFDCDQVIDPQDPMLLPGMLKYGGVGGMTQLVNATTVYGLQTDRWHNKYVEPHKYAKKGPPDLLDSLINPK